MEKAGLEDYRPRWKAYNKLYSPALAMQIRRDLGSNFIVIKPINSGRSNGIIMVHRNQLDPTLQKLFGSQTTTTNHTQKDSLNHRPKNPKLSEYWQNDTNDFFLAESMEESKTIVHEGNPYDPTMRVVFILCHSAGKISTTILGGYWKIPPKPLSDSTASLTEQHKTVSMHNDYTAIKVAPEDFDQVKSILYKILPRIYEGMLLQA